MDFWSKSGVALDQTSFVMAWQGDYCLSCSSTRRGVSRLGGGWGGEGGTEVCVWCVWGNDMLGQRSREAGGGGKDF